MLPADLHALGGDLRVAATRVATRARRRRRAFMAISILVVLGACGGAALAAAGLLGAPAPAGVQTDLHRAARFTWNGHSVLQVQNAIVVAQGRDAMLYSVRDGQGNYCAELLGTGRTLIFGFSCSLSRHAPNGQLLADSVGTNVQYAVPRNGVSVPVVQFGRLPLRTESARAVYGNGAVDKIPLGLDGFYVYEPTGHMQELARRLPMTVQFLDRDAHPVWSYYVQPPQPLRVEDGALPTVSGHCVIAGASKVRVNVSPYFSAPSTIVYIPIHRDGSFSWTGHRGERVYNVTVVDDNALPVSADAEPLTTEGVKAMTALVKRAGR